VGGDTIIDRLGGLFGRRRKPASAGEQAPSTPGAQPPPAPVAPADPAEPPGEEPFATGYT
jgi:hypothetical protein